MRFIIIALSEDNSKHRGLMPGYYKESPSVKHIAASKHSKQSPLSIIPILNSAHNLSLLPPFSRVLSSMCAYIKESRASQEVLDTTRRRAASTSSPTASTTAGQARDDDVEEGCDCADDGLQDAGDAVDDCHEAVADCAEERGDLFFLLAFKADNQKLIVRVAYAGYNGTHFECVLR
jgi:hypothetical protein